MTFMLTLIVESVTLILPRRCLFLLILLFSVYVRLFMWFISSQATTDYTLEQVEAGKRSNFRL